MKLSTIAVLSIALQISACSLSRTIEQPVHLSSLTAKPHNTAQTLIARDFVNALSQLESLQSGATTVAVLTADRQDSFTLAMHGALEQAGYAIQWLAQEGADNLFQYRRHQEQPTTGVYRDFYELAVGSVEMRRGYARDSQQRVWPVTPFYVRGADASNMVLNDAIFDHGQPAKMTGTKTTMVIGDSDVTGSSTASPTPAASIDGQSTTNGDESAPDRATEQGKRAALPSTESFDATTEPESVLNVVPEFATLLESPTWVHDQDKRLFTIQMSTSQDLASLQDFLKHNPLPSPNAVFSFERDGEAWFALLHGIFPTKTDAQRVVEQMPPLAQRDQPWIRSIATLQSSLRLQVPNNTNSSTPLVTSSLAPSAPLPLLVAPAYRNVFDIGVSNFLDLLAGYTVIKEQVLTFPNDSMRLGQLNKHLVNQLVDTFNPHTDMFSVIGCSIGPTAFKGGDSDLALGRADRVVEALHFSGVDSKHILDEGCWAGGGSLDSLPRRSVVLTLNRRG